ncbi:MAG: YmdB family metallophosphoesterase [Solirubrobacteraceae bacterium]|nr:YmdB family metallophosphoesterase [Solirubrobacteraceae bacterium]
MADGPSILFIGDVIGSIGRQALRAALPELRAEHDPTFVVVNGENAAGGVGITPGIADEFFGWGVDVITLGNHTYRQREVWRYLDDTDAIVRPANYLQSQPGHGSCIVERDGVRLGVLNLMGELYLHPGRVLFAQAEVEVEKLRRAGVDHILVDIHGEATSEKVALGWELDGRVTAVVGTHTHVPTADARVLPGGTAYMTDVGMCGPRDSVIGVRKELAIEAMRTKMPVRFEPAKGDPWLCAALIRCGDRPNRATEIVPIQRSPNVVG